MNDAAAEFEKAAAIEATPVVHNNLGVIARLRGDIAKAKEHYAKAGGAGNEVSYNQGIIQIMEGKYAAAVSIIYFAFHFLWAYNYYRQPLHKNLNLNSDYNTDELVRVTKKLIDKRREKIRNLMNT